jgi:hypothetical protein
LQVSRSEPCWQHGSAWRPPARRVPHHLTRKLPQHPPSESILIVTSGQSFAPRVSSATARRNRRGNYVLDMVVQESPPSLGTGFPVLGHEAGNRALRDRDSQLEQFPVNARRAPVRVLDPSGHHDWPVSAVKLVDVLAGESPASAVSQLALHCSDIRRRRGRPTRRKPGRKRPRGLDANPVCSDKEGKPSNRS